jgi:hypothetical protein
MTQYEEVQIEAPSQPVIKKTDSNGNIFWIPLDPANSDYQRYLAWLENPEAEEIPNTL